MSGEEEIDRLHQEAYTHARCGRIEEALAGYAVAADLAEEMGNAFRARMIRLNRRRVVALRWCLANWPPEQRVGIRQVMPGQGDWRFIVGNTVLHVDARDVVTVVPARAADQDGVWHFGEETDAMKLPRKRGPK